MTVSQIKFDYCIQAMPQEVTFEVLNLIRYPPTKNPCQHLKDRLLRVYALYNYACAKAIANLPVSGDMQTSSLMSWVIGLLPLVHTLVSS